MSAFFVVAAFVFWSAATAVAYARGNHGWAWVMLVVAAVVAADAAGDE